MRRLGAERYMMATTASHKMGDISRESPSLCVVYGEEEEDWVGRFLTGLGFFDVHFPKKTTRELTKKEKEEWNGAAFGVGDSVLNVVVFPGFGVPKQATVVKTKKSTYRLGKTEAVGTRTIVRDGKPLDFSTGKIVLLKVGRPMVIDRLNGDEWVTTPVLSVESEKRRRPPRQTRATLS